MSVAKIHYFLVTILLSLILSIVVGVRDLSIGTDTYAYADFFIKQNVDSISDNRYEPLFKYLTLSIKLLTDDVSVYFSIVFILFNVMLLYTTYLYVNYVKNIDLSTIYFSAGIFLFSSWYMVATVNGIRNGLALPFLYLSIFLLVEKRWFLFLAFFIISTQFHYSTVLYLPFLALIFTKDKALMFFFLTSAIFYPLGFNEKIVKVMSDLSGLGLYESIKYYGLDVVSYYGFNSIQYIYSFGLGVIFYLSSFFVVKERKDKYFKLVKIYILLISPYFFFGFGGFSNRFAFGAWLYAPVLYVVFINNVRNRFISDNFYIFSSVCVFVLGLTDYFFRIHPLE
ncbi:EpsG family protein [Vibrio alginolyticus]|uniref:EpsG family protein n=1 Tax=Vibrio alginolyticus TaxID=663 RepID=UPI003752FE51